MHACVRGQGHQLRRTSFTSCIGAEHQRAVYQRAGRGPALVSVSVSVSARVRVCVSLSRRVANKRWRLRRHLGSSVVV